MIELLIGGARSGKSALAERRALEWQHAAASRRVVYVATAYAGDDEMRVRIAHHQTRRPPDWALAEVGAPLADTLREQAHQDVFLLVDCLTLWLTGLLYSGAAAAQADAGEPINCPLLASQRHALLTTLPELPGEVALVSNEVGWGIVPLGASTRLFVDEQGRLNQAIAALADRVTFVTAGLPLRIK